jgi:hypothetical protein
MKRVKLIATALALTALAVLTSGVAAQETNTSERTFLTFSGAVEMPGVTLQPGTYVFKLADTPTRNVVQVWDRDEKNMIGHWLFVQAERPQVSGETVVMFKETREGTTPAVQYWYFPGERIGKEFVYPKDQAQRIASRTGMDVRTEDGVIEGDGIAGVQTEAAVTADSTLQNAPASAQPTASAGSLAGNRGVETEKAEAPAPAPLPVEVDANAGVTDNRVAASADVSANRSVGTSGSAEAQIAQDNRATELPRTASPLALSGLLGLLSLAGAAGLRATRR